MGSTDKPDDNKAATPGLGQSPLTDGSEWQPATTAQGKTGRADAEEASSSRGATDAGKSAVSAMPQASAAQLNTSTNTHHRQHGNQLQVNVLQTRMINRRNQCYANALITCLHSVCHEANSQIGNIQDAILELARHTEADVFTQNTWAPFFRGWRRPTQQHDVTELLHHFTPYLQGTALQGEWAVHRPSPGQPLRLMDFSPTMPYISMHIGAHRCIQDIANSWSQDHKSLLTHSPRILLISLVRFNYQFNQARKLRCSVRVKKQIRICAKGEAVHSAPEEEAVPSAPEERLEQAFPFPVHSLSYELMGGIIHIGDLAHTGHYRAFTVLRNFDRSAELTHHDVLMHDDNITPQPARRSNIAQIASNVYVLAYRRGGSS